MSGRWMENYQEAASRAGEFLLKWPDRFLLEAGQGLTLQRSESLDQISGMISQSHLEPSDRKSGQSRDLTAASTSPPGCLPEASLVEGKML